MTADTVLRILSPLVFCIGFSRILSGDQGFDGQWYDDLQQPPLRPPSWVFGPVWTVLYLLIGVALARMADDDEGTALLAVHLVLNAIWTPIFVHQHFGWAAAVLVLMLVTLGAVVSHSDATTAALLAPYGMWIMFALYLNIYIALNN